MAALLATVFVALAPAIAAAAPAPPAASGPDEDEEAPKKPAVDPSVVPGPRILYGARPGPVHEARLCSTRTPVCVHARSRGQEQVALAVLEAFDEYTGA